MIETGGGMETEISPGRKKGATMRKAIMSHWMSPTTSKRG